MITLRIIILTVLAILPFALDSFLDNSKFDMKRRNFFYRCFISFTYLFTESRVYYSIKRKFRILHNLLSRSTNARKFLVYSTIICLITYQFIDYSCYNCNFNNTQYLCHDDKSPNSILSILYNIIPPQYFASFIITISLFFYSIANPLLLSLHKLDDRLFLVVNYINLLLLYINETDVLNITLYIILLSASFYAEYSPGETPKDKMPLTKPKETNIFNNILSPNLNNAA